MESALSELLNPVLQQWPMVLVLLAVGFYVWRTFQACLDEHKRHIDWLQAMVEKLQERE